MKKKTTTNKQENTDGHGLREAPEEPDSVIISYLENSAGLAVYGEGSQNFALRVRRIYRRDRWIVQWRAL